MHTQGFDNKIQERWLFTPFLKFPNLMLVRAIPNSHIRSCSSNSPSFNWMEPNEALSNPFS